VTFSDTRSTTLSVVIVSWNTRDLLDRCLRSVVADAEQAQIEPEIIVVDNASTDGSVAWLRERHPDVPMIALERNVGFATAINVGIRRSTGNALLLLNPDTELHPGALAALVDALYSTPHVGMVSGLLLNPDGTFQSSGYRFPGLVQSFLDFFPLHPRLMASRVNGRFVPGDGATPYEVDHPLGACMLVRRETIERVGWLDEQYFMYSEEIDWSRRLRMNGWTILIAPAARIVHYGGQSTGQLPDDMFLELHRSRARYFQRYQSPAFIRTVERMAQVASRWAEHRPQRSDAQRTRSELLKSVSRIYAEARDNHD
jgi:N-acetylglucosaminyl-diphospho-decaprenol L-rhamnosyltransferase